MQPGQFKPPGDEGWIGRKFQDLERQLNELRAANPFATMGVKPMPDGLIVEGYETVNGPLLINGPATITGALNLPAGIIGNAALANPVQMETSSNYLSNYAIGTTSTVRASLTLTVPPGFTQAVIIANPTGMGQNSTATVDYLYVQAIIQGTPGGELYTSAGAGLAVGVASPVHMTLYGLTDGEEITVSVATRTGFATWAAAPGNQANIYATAIYLR